MPDRDHNIASQAMTILPHSPEPMGHADNNPLLVITETVALTIRVEDHEPVKIEVCRLARSPHWTIRLLDPPQTAARVTRTDDGGDDGYGYAAFDIAIPNQIASVTVTR